jgi:hypothetical protein
VAPDPDQERLLVSKVRAAALLSISIDTFERLVMPEVRTVHIGRRVLFAVPDLARWVDEHTARPLHAQFPHQRRLDACTARPARRSLPSRRGAMVQHNIKSGPARVTTARPRQLGGSQDAR